MIRRMGPDRAEASEQGRWAVAVAGVVLLALVLRLWGATHGLPFSYHGDENGHFVPPAVRFFEHGFNPGWFVNPPGFTEILYLVFAGRYGFGDGAARALATDPGEVFLLARVTSAVLGAAAVWLLYLAGARLFDRRVALVAAGLLAVAFMPVFYGHRALNDGPALAWIALALYGAGGVLRLGRTRDYLVAGLGVGLAAGTKYTAGIVVLALLAAALVRLRSGERRPALAGLLAGLAAALLAFLAATPYALLDADTFLRDLGRQAHWANAAPLIGEPYRNGFAFYLRTLGWALGWVPLAAAPVGAALLLRRDRRAGAVLLPAPLAFLAYMGSHSRFVGHYVLPMVPPLCLLAGYAGVRAAEALTRGRPSLRAAATALAAGVLGAQSAVHAVHNDLVLSRPDTRNLARAWLLEHLPRGTRVVVEPLVPKYRAGVGAPWLGERGGSGAFRERPVRRRHYWFTVAPDLVERYAREGYCWVVSASTVADIAFVEPERTREAIAYYRRLERGSTVAFQASPFDPEAGPIGPGRTPVPFNWDFSDNQYPLAYHRPGPRVTVYRLTDRRCGEARGPRTG